MPFKYSIGLNNMFCADEIVIIFYKDILFDAVDFFHLGEKETGRWL